MATRMPRIKTDQAPACGVSRFMDTHAFAEGGRKSVFIRGHPWHPCCYPAALAFSFDNLIVYNQL
jgi:hypothetical protein